MSWSQIERTILLRIARNEYSPGQQLPTCEALAAEFGANKNTVNKAYRSLAQRGYVVTRAGFGTFVGKRPARIDLDRTLEGVSDLVSLAVQEAKLNGLGLQAFRKLVDDLVAQAYGHAGPRVGFIECNRHDATTLSRDLQSALSHPIEPLLIDDVVAAPERFLREYDVLAVNITHLSALESALGRSKAGAAEVVGIYIPVDPESLMRVARFRSGTRVGIVCDLQQTLVSLKGMVEAYNPALRVQGCLTRDRTAVRQLFESSDVLLLTPSAAGRLRAGESQVPIITLAFRPDSRSVEQLSALIVRRSAMPVARQGASKSRRAAARGR